MPDLEEKVYLLDTRVSDVEKGLSVAKVDQLHYIEKVEDVERIIIDHMRKEESDREIMEEKIDGLIRYKWILFGAMVMLYLTSGNHQLLELIGVIK